MRCQIKLNSITDVKEFVNITFKAENDVDLICGKYHIDGKSIMGVFALGFEPVEIEFMEGNAQMEEYLSAYAL